MPTLLEFIACIIGICAWPVTVLILVWIIRRERKQRAARDRDNG